MKKTLMTLLATVLVSGGMVGVSAVTTSAQADPYPGTIVTLCDSGGPHKMAAGRTPKSTLFVKSAGNGKPLGKVRVQYIHKGTRKSKAKAGVRYNGKRVTFFGPKLTKPGKYVVRLTMTPAADSVFQGCKDSYALTVFKKKKS